MIDVKISFLEKCLLVNLAKIQIMSEQSIFHEGFQTNHGIVDMMMDPSGMNSLSHKEVH